MFFLTWIAIFFFFSNLTFFFLFSFLITIILWRSWGEIIGERDNLMREMEKGFFFFFFFKKGNLFYLFICLFIYIHIFFGLLQKLFSIAKITSLKKITLFEVKDADAEVSLDFCNYNTLSIIPNCSPTLSLSLF